MPLNRYLRRLLTPARPDPPDRTQVSNERIGEVLANQCPNWEDGVKRMPLDATYWTTSRPEWGRIIL